MSTPTNKMNDLTLPVIDSATVKTVIKMPVKIMKNVYEGFLSVSDAKALYASRNDQRVVKPFLSGLNVTFTNVHRIVIVRNSEALLGQLNNLGFRSSSELFPKTAEFLKLLDEAKGLSKIQVFHKDFAIELHIVDDKTWELAATAKIVTKDLKVKMTAEVSTFLTVFAGLSKVSNALATDNIDRARVLSDLTLKK